MSEYVGWCGFEVRGDDVYYVGPPEASGVQNQQLLGRLVKNEADTGPEWFFMPSGSLVDSQIIAGLRRVVLDPEHYRYPCGYKYPERTVAVLNDGCSVITVDDNCYQIRNWHRDNTWAISSWIFGEAVEVLRRLPANPNDAKWLPHGERL